jgi:hypothetical protein
MEGFSDHVILTRLILAGGKDGPQKKQEEGRSWHPFCLGLDSGSLFEK